MGMTNGIGLRFERDRPGSGPQTAPTELPSIASPAGQTQETGRAALPCERPSATQSPASHMVPERFRADFKAIMLDMSGVASCDHEAVHCALQAENLRRQRRAKMLDRLRDGDVLHVSLCALAPRRPLFWRWTVQLVS